MECFFSCRADIALIGLAVMVRATEGMACMKTELYLRSCVYYLGPKSHPEHERSWICGLCLQQNGSQGGELSCK